VSPFSGDSQLVCARSSPAQVGVQFQANCAGLCVRLCGPPPARFLGRPNHVVRPWSGTAAPCCGTDRLSSFCRPQRLRSFYRSTDPRSPSRPSVTRNSFASHSVTLVTQKARKIDFLCVARIPHSSQRVDLRWRAIANGKWNPFLVPTMSYTDPRNRQTRQT
jgi:hypothetical protein